MAGGWSRDGAVQDQIDQSIADAVKHARDALAQGGESRPDCEECGEPIPEARRRAVPGVRRCVGCQEALDAEARFQSTFNRRGSKDSQLR
ncbi:MAG: DksA/TraR family C4-type zinc finger protein [Gammaproteobacteria bacterium]